MSSRNGSRILLHKVIITLSLCNKLLLGWKPQLSLQQSATLQNGNPNVMLKVSHTALCQTHVNMKYEDYSPPETVLNQCTCTHVKNAHAHTHGSMIPMVRVYQTSTSKSCLARIIYITLVNSSHFIASFPFLFSDA